MPLQASRGIAVVRFAKGHKIGVIGVIVLDKDALVLKPGDGYTILVVFSEGCESEAEGGSRPQLLARSGGLAPV